MFRKDELFVITRFLVGSNINVEGGDFAEFQIEKRKEGEDLRLILMNPKEKEKTWILFNSALFIG